MKKFYLLKEDNDGELMFYTHFCGLTSNKSQAAIYTENHLRSVEDSRISKLLVDK